MHAHAAYAQEPESFTTAPIGALRKLFTRTGWQPSDVDYCEINAAFTVAPMAVMREFGLPRAHVNAHGGACAIGHPIGASGARIVVTLRDVLRARGAASRACASAAATRPRWRSS
ncbi:acetyl-CoA acetyltransferase [Burkholderia sp. ABCPW 14]|nr:acetyl-CoA acetyltransferase [Burkholderia sp. ABCPW 14]